MLIRDFSLLVLAQSLPATHTATVFRDLLGGQHVALFFPDVLKRHVAKHPQNIVAKHLKVLV